jgi:eukaryotic-like serine/threonine-protein kinase
VSNTRQFGDRFVDPRDATGSYEAGTLPAHLADTSATIQWQGETLPELVPETGDAHPKAADIYKAGQVVDGKYEIRRILGAGGMGQVFEAQDRELNRLVALKACWPHVGDESLKREARVLAAFRAPGLVTVHELATDGGITFMIMERLSGTTLAELLIRRNGPLPIDEAVRIMLAMCDSLAPLHASGLAHADLKPANIMLAPGDRMVLLDFGIARIEQLRAGSQRITGSPHYMAPEAIRGAIQVGAAHLIDIYALGVIGFVMLTGQPPFQHDNPIELMMAHVHHEPPRVSSLRPDVPASIDRLFDELLAKDPADRPADIDVVRAELRRPRA